MEDKEARQQYDEQLKERQTFQSVFSTNEGQAVLAIMLNRLHYYANDPEYIDPQLTAFANWLLGKIGSLTVDNLGEFTKAVVGASSTKDIHNAFNFMKDVEF